ncbi:MAG TPA: hypothetical protein VFB80_01545 [Pirellulaceae bacterium]|nr:hypothetical protein [Pirellulaceae bacterium]
MTGTVASTQTESQTTNYFSNYLPPADPNRIYRVVGFMEYSKALESLDALAALATNYELAAIDEIVKSEPEFTIYTNLARRLERGRSNLAEKPAGENDDFARKGFRWVTALARVEVGAMLAGFSSHPQPFAAVAGTGYDLAEYKELLLDGAKMHFWALTNDPGFTAIMRKFNPSGTTLAYLRRLNVASAFVSALVASAGREFNPAQVQEVKLYATKLEGSRGDIRLSIENYLQQVMASTKTNLVGRQDNILLEACYKNVCQQYSRDVAALPRQ